MATRNTGNRKSDSTGHNKQLNGVLATPTPCGNIKCKLEVETGAIRCDGCTQWYHNRCSKLTPRILALHTANKGLTWICPTCIGKLKRKEGVTVGTQTEQQQQTDERTPSKNLPATNSPTQAINNMNNHRVKANRGDASQAGCGTSEQNGKKAPGSRANLGAQPTARKKINRVTKPVRPKVDGKNGSLPGAGKIEVTLRKQQEVIEALQRDRDSLSKTVHTLLAKTDIALGRNRNVVIKGIPEPFMRQGKQRERAIRHHLSNFLRMAEMEPHTGVKRVLRLGRWRVNHIPAKTAVRPVLVEFTNPRNRDRFLAAAGIVAHKTKQAIRIEPDDSAAWREQRDKPKLQVGTNENPENRVPKVQITRVPEPQVVSDEASEVQELTPEETGCPPRSNEGATPEQKNGIRPRT